MSCGCLERHNGGSASCRIVRPVIEAVTTATVESLNLSLANPAGLAAGDLQVCVVGSITGAGMNNQIRVNDGWANLGRALGVGDMSAISKRADATDIAAGSVLFQPGAVANRVLAGAFFRISNLATVNTIAEINREGLATSTATTNHTAPARTLGPDGGLVICACAVDANVALTTPATLTEHANLGLTGAVNAIRYAVGSKLVAGATSSAETFTTVGNEDGIQVSVVVPFGRVAA